MPDAPCRLVPPIAAALSLFAAVSAQDAPIRFAPIDPMIRLSICDAPALRAALPNTHLGRLFAEPEVAAAIATGRDHYVAKVQAWTSTVDRLLQLDPGRATVEALELREVMDLDWRDLATAELVATRLDGSEWSGVQTTLLLEPVAAAEGKLARRFERLQARLRAIAADADHAANLRLDGDKVDGFPALVLTARDMDKDEYRYGAPPGAWLLHLPGQFAGGDGKVGLVGKCAPTPPAAAAISLQIGILGYLDLLGGAGAANVQVQTVRKALGLDAAGAIRWQLRPVGELLQDDIALALTGRPGGVLGALLDGIAPLVDQPLPEHGLLQLRCAFDVAELTAAIDELLALGDAPTLADTGIAEDLKQAWTGGMALAIARPAPGGLMPRLYASFGIADAQAFGRLIARLRELPELQPKDVKYEGRPCVQLRIDGAPAALQPSYCLQDGVVHFAESGLSLRALLKAQANGTPPALDVGDAPRPEGPGAALPGFDLRFDGAAIHAAIHELWLPLGSSMLGTGASGQPLVPMAEMPEPEVVTRHLRPGRGVLRRSPDQVVLGMSGTAGGPELHVLLAAYGPLLSGPMTQSWSWQTDALRYDLAHVQLQAVHAALTRFRERTGKAPASFGELLASGDLADASLLLLPGDDSAEPVLHDGREVARTSFAYFPDGKQMSPQGEEILARVATLHSIAWRGLALADDGVLHDTWDERMPIFAPEVVVEPAAVEVEPEKPPPNPAPVPDDPPK